MLFLSQWIWLTQSKAVPLWYILLSTLLFFPFLNLYQASYFVSVQHIRAINSRQETKIYCYSVAGKTLIWIQSKISSTVLFSIKILCSRSEMQAQVHESEEPDLFFSILKSLIVLKVCLNPTFVFVLSIKYCNCPYSVVLLAQLSVCIDMQGGRSTVYKNSTDKEKQNASLFRIQGLGYESVQAIEVDLVSITVRSKILYQNLHFLLFFYLICRFRLHEVPYNYVIFFFKIHFLVYLLITSNIYHNFQVT